MGSVWAVVVAAGSGSRFGGSKQFSLLRGRTVVDWSLDVARSVCHGVVVVVPAGAVVVPAGAVVVPAGAVVVPAGAVVVPAGAVVVPPGASAADEVVVGGATRSASVRAGLAAVPADADVVVVHDAARPLAGPALWEAAIAAVRDGADGAVCAVPVTDTIKRVAGGFVIDTLDREGLVAVQTPQAFRAAVLRSAHAGGGESTDDAALVEAAGGSVVTVPGSPHNLKITHAHDLAVAAALAPWATT